VIIAISESRTTPAAVNLLGAFLNELNAYVRSGRLTDAQTVLISTMTQRLIASVSAS